MARCAIQSFAKSQRYAREFPHHCDFRPEKVRPRSCSLQQVHARSAASRQPEIVVGTWRAARAQDDGINEAEVRDALFLIGPLWDALFPAEQARIVQLLVERIEIAEDGLDIRLRNDGLAGLVREFGVGARKAA